jgi:outer membrane protein OmpA-like peptidoglycan-associated protein
LNKALEGTQAELTQTKNIAANLQSELSKASSEAQGLKGQIHSLKSGFAKQQAADKRAFEAGLNKLKLSAAARAAREAKFKAEASRKAGQLQAKVAGLEGQLKSTEGALAKAKEEIDTRRSVAKEISEGFAKAGIKADIDMQTGDVVLDFGDAYFDNNSADLKPKMRQVIERAMPIYSKSLFGNPKVANKISNVEIIGFASPTYQGRYIDPQSSKPEDKAALKYNMDLSYQRANAIFQHLVDEKNPGFTNQQKLMSLMKVSGRSFLDVLKVKDRNIASAAEFCRVNDCRKAQRVIVRFSVDGK